MTYARARFASIKLPRVQRASLLLVVLIACGGTRSPATPPETARPSIDASRLMQHITQLASDEFEGRAPGTKGEELTVRYLEEQFRAIGLAPGNTDGTFVQNVPLVGMTPDQKMQMQIGGKPLVFGTDFVAWTRRVVPEIRVDDSELVFVGYGVVAPEFEWDDYKGADLEGKTLVMLVNDPPVEGAFGGRAMTYYGRWTYKYEIGAKVGAAGVLLVHETVPAGYPWDVVKGFGGQRFDLVTEDKNMGMMPFEAWISDGTARALVQSRGLDFAKLKEQAARRDFKPIPLGVSASIAFSNATSTLMSRNVLAKLEGSDPALRDEYIIYTAHWDHLGKGTPVDGDAIYNGAIDNATGTAGLVEIARATAAGPRPKRSLLFLAVAAEEQGLLGSEFYATHPIYPLDRTVATINMDALGVFGRARDVIVVGLGMSDLDDYVRDIAGTQGRTVRPDASPEKGYYYRSDHFSFAKLGVPSLYVDSGLDLIGKPPGSGLRLMEEYTAKRYHQPSDEVTPDWDLSGLVEDLELLATFGIRVANAPKWPEWKPGTEFRATREAMLDKR